MLAVGVCAEITLVRDRQMTEELVPKTGKTRGRPAQMKAGKGINVYLDPVTVTRAKQIGDGNLSAGLRIAVELAIERQYPSD
jgi:hypothetical protein